MPSLSISLLGPFRVDLDGQPITAFRTTKVRALLAYLVVEAHRYPKGLPRQHPRTTLAGLLWPEQPERAALASLRNALATLRTVLGDRDARSPFLHVTHETIQFNPTSDCWLDVAAFSEAIAASKQHAHRRLETCPSCAQRLREAVALYRGEFLAGLSVDSVPFEEWLVLQWEALHRQVLDALWALAAYHERRGEYEQAISYARRQIELEGWREEAHRQVMRALALNGQRGAALAQYETCRRTLMEELGAEPEEETTTLYRSIRDGQALDLASAGPPNNLPAQLTPFIGRGALLAEIAQHLRDPACRLLTLIGPGGSGKTRLALEAAAQELDNYAHGVFFVALAPLRSVESIVPTIVQVIGLPLSAGGEPKAQLLNYLRGKSVLLILDNCEHLVKGASMATDILKAAPKVKVLITSRAGLHVQGEHRLPVQGMPYPDQTSEVWQTFDVCNRYSAVKLFLQSARRAQPDFELTDEMLPDVVRICHLVEGMPLGILMAAAWVALFTPAEIAAEIEHSLDFLESDLRDVPERQRSMRAVFDHSWNLLPAREREAIQALSVFRGGFTREAAQQVTDVSVRTLMNLIDRSLLQRMATGRYEVHELLRQYAAEKLAASPDAERSARDRHSAHYAAALARWAADLKGPQQQAALKEIEAEVADARAAWEWVVGQGQMERLARAMEGLGLFYDWRARYQEGEAAFRAVAEGLATAGEALLATPVERLHVRGNALAWQSLFSLRSGRPDRAREYLGQGMDLLDHLPLTDLNTRRERAFLLWVLGQVAYWSGDRREAREPCAQSLALYRALGDRWGMANALLTLGVIAQSLGELDQAGQFHQEALSIRRGLGDRRGIIESFLAVAWVQQAQGQFEQAERLERESVALCREMGDRVALAGALIRLGGTLRWQGKVAESRPWAEEGLAICSDLGLHEEPNAITLLAILKTDLGQYEEAYALFQQGLDLAEERDRPWTVGRALLGLGTLALVKGEFVEARRRLEESVAVWRAMGQQSNVGWPHAFLAGAARGPGQRCQARRHLCEALRIAVQLRNALMMRVALPFAALLLADRGAAERAVEVYALASCYHPPVGNSRFWQDIAGKHIAAIAATLPPGAIAAAQERGRARDLWATAKELLAEFDKG